MRLQGPGATALAVEPSPPPLSGVNALSLTRAALFSGVLDTSTSSKVSRNGPCEAAVNDLGRAGGCTRPCLRSEANVSARLRHTCANIRQLCRSPRRTLAAQRRHRVWASSKSKTLQRLGRSARVGGPENGHEVALGSSCNQGFAGRGRNTIDGSAGRIRQESVQPTWRTAIEPGPTDHTFLKFAGS